MAAAGALSGFYAVEKFGRNPDVDGNSAPEDVWNGGGDYTGQPEGPPPDVAETVTVVSSSTADADEGTGMRSIRLAGLGADGLIQTEDIVLDGTTPVTSVMEWYTVTRMYGLTAGSGKTNAGSITTAMSSTTSNVCAVLPAGFAQTQIAAITVPANCEAIIRRRQAGVSNNQSQAQEAEIALMHRPYREEADSIWRARRAFTVSTLAGQTEDHMTMGIRLDPLDAVKMRVIDATADNLSCTAQFDILFYPADPPITFS